MMDIGDLLEGDDGAEGDDMLGDDMLGEMDGDSLVGDSLVGDSLVGDTEIGSFMSRLRHPLRRKRSPMQQAILAKQVQNAQLLRTLKVTGKRNWTLPFGPTSVAAAATQSISVQPQKEFRGRRLIIPSPIAPNFRFSIVVGVATQQAQFGFLSAIAFTETAIGTNMGLDTAQIGNTITLSAQNTDTVNAHIFEAMLLGVALMKGPC